ncbi:MAG: hypothetical protein LUO91_06570 [Methanomicrobiales archaeon]|jgi:hypothetical protein|nr:hypothetical protein [Methanomicrobiales archaeon]
MTKKGEQPMRTCRSAREFEQMFLPKTHARKHKERVMHDPVKFGERLKERLIKAIRK